MEYLSLRQHEFETTLRVLQAYPEDKISIRPAPKSRTAAELAMVFASEERVIKVLVETGATSTQLPRLQVPDTMAGIISAWQEAVSANTALLSKLTPAELEKVVDFYGLRVTLADALWIELLDHIHHRGQFSVYLRLAGARVPSIYGPTADVIMG